MRVEKCFFSQSYVNVICLVSVLTDFNSHSILFLRHRVL